MVATRSGPPAKSSPKRLSVRIKAQQALELRLVGATWETIAQRLQYAHRSNAYRAVMRLMEANARPVIEEAAHVEYARLERLNLALWTRAIQGDLKAVDLVLKIAARRAALLGLDAPKRREPTALDGGPIGTTSEVEQRVVGERIVQGDLSRLSSEQLDVLERIFESAGPPAAP